MKIEFLMVGRSDKAAKTNLENECNNFLPSFTLNN
jgi:hypothetical protein